MVVLAIGFLCFAQREEMVVGLFVQLVILRCIKMTNDTLRSPQQDEELPSISPPGSPPAFHDDDPDAGLQFRRRAHTFSHPPVKKRISFEGQTGNQGKQAPLRRQQSVATELLQSR